MSTVNNKQTETIKHDPSSLSIVLLSLDMNECSLLTKHKFQCTVPASQDALSLLALSVQQTTPPAPERGQTTGPDPHLDTLVQSRECTVTPPHSTDHTIIGFTTDAFPLPKHFLVTVSVGHKQR